MLFLRFRICAQLFILLSNSFANTSPNSIQISDLFNVFIFGIASFVSDGERQHSITDQLQHSVELTMANAQMLQHWIGQMGQQIVVEDGTFAGVYSCVAVNEVKDFKDIFLSVQMPENQKNSLGHLLDKIQKVGRRKIHFLKMFFAFGALLSAKIGEQAPRENCLLRLLLKAFECVAGEKGLEGESDVPTILISPVMVGQIEQLNIEKILLKISPAIEESQGPKEERSTELSSFRQNRDDFALLNKLNIKMTPRNALEFASFANEMLSTQSWPNLMDENSHLRNPFEKIFLKKIGLTIANIDQDPVKHRRIAHQLLIHLRNWSPKELEEISVDKKFKIQLSDREQCIFGIFARNLMQRMAHYELMEEYCGKLNLFIFGLSLTRIINEKNNLESFIMRKCKNNGTKDAKTKGEETTTESESTEAETTGDEHRENEDEQQEEERGICGHYDDAIHIDWNIWTEIINQIGHIRDTIKIKHKNKELSTYLKDFTYEQVMKLINSEFDKEKYGLALKMEKNMNGKEMPKPTIKEFCANLETIRQISKERSEQYEKEVPFQPNIVIKQKENYEKFFDFLKIFVAGIFSGRYVKDEKLEIDLKNANLLLDKLHQMAKNVQMIENKKECNFKTEIEKIMDKKLDEKFQKIFRQFEEPNEFVKVFNKSADYGKGMDPTYKSFINAQLFDLLFSFAVRFEALIHGKKNGGTIEEKKEEKQKAKKIQTFLSVWNSFSVPEWANKFGIFNNWMEIENLKTKEGKCQIPLVIQVGIHRKVYENDKATEISRESFKMLKRLNEQIFSIYETTKLLEKITDVFRSFSYIPIPKIFNDLVQHLKEENSRKWERNHFVYNKYGTLIEKCGFVMLFQNLSKKFIKMMDEKGIDSQKHLDESDYRLQNIVKDKEFPKFCERLETLVGNGKETTAVRFNNVRYDLVVHFAFNREKDIRDRAEDLMVEWEHNYSAYKTTFETISDRLLEKIYIYFTWEKNKEKVTKMVALNENDKTLKKMLVQFDELSELVKDIKENNLKLKRAKNELKEKEQFKGKNENEKKIVMKKLEEISEKIKEKEIKAEQLEKEIKLLKKNHDSSGFWHLLVENGKKRGEEEEKEEGMKKEEEKEILKKIEKIKEFEKNIFKLNEETENGIKKMKKELDEMRAKEKETTPGKITKAKEFLKNIKEKALKMELLEEEREALLEGEDEQILQEEKDKLLREEKEQQLAQQKLEEKEKMQKMAQELKKAEKLQQKLTNINLKAMILSLQIIEIEMLCRKKFEKNEEKNKKTQKGEEELEKVVEEFEKEIGELSKLEKQLEETLTECNIENRDKEILKTKQEILQMKESVKDIEKEMQTIDQNLAQIPEKMAKNQKEIDQLEPPFKEILKLTKNFGQIIENVKKHYEKEFAKNSA